jgi:predicted metal-binding membrane protein
VMSITWMAVVSALIAAEKTLPWRRPATYATALVLVALALMLILMPGALPGLTIPGSGGMMGMAP